MKAKIKVGYTVGVDATFRLFATLLLQLANCRAVMLGWSSLVNPTSARAAGVDPAAVVAVAVAVLDRARVGVMTVNGLVARALNGQFCYL